MKYAPYRPTALEQRIDKLVRLISPRIQANRVINREREHYFRYMSAYPTSSRRNATSMTSGETMKGSREKLQVMWNAINAVDNSGLCTSIVNKFQLYVCGTLRWQSRCGDRTIANEYEDYMRTALSKSLDVTGRYSLRQMAMLDIRGILIKGDIGTNVVRDGKNLYLQGVEADRIGNPYDWKIDNNYVRGLELDDTGRIMAVRVYNRNRTTGMYSYDSTVPMQDKRGFPQFMLLNNPISYDDYRGVSVFKTAIDNATYIDKIREYELQALMWAASQSGVFHTKSGTLPEALPFDMINPIVDQSGNKIETYTVRPNTVTALGVGEDVTMFQHDRPSPNVIGILKETVRDISVGTGLSYGMVWDMSGYTGPAVRLISAQDARTIELWQWLLREGKLDPVAMLVLGNAIANGELPMTPNWNKWEWFFPAKSTIDVGRESQANIEEIQAGINTGARVAADDGMDIDEIQQQRGRETEAMVEVAMEVADNLSSGGETIDWHEIYQLMVPPPKGAGGMGGGFPPSPDGPGATTDGVVIGGRSSGSNGKRNGQKTKSRFRQPDAAYELRRVLHDALEEWYSDDQPRDNQGRWTDEGGAITDTAATPVMTGIDKRLIDYKSGSRPLNDPTKVIPLTHIIPNSRYVPYSKTPFFEGVSAMQFAERDKASGDTENGRSGTYDLNKVSGLEYKKSRDLLFNKQPVEDVPVTGMVITQPNVNRERIAQMARNPLGIGLEGTETGPIQVASYNGENHSLNGHHRIASDTLKGATSMKAHVLMVTEQEQQVYANALKAKPQLDKMLNEVATAHGGQALTPGLKTLDRARAKMIERNPDGSPKYKNFSDIKDIARGRLLGETDADVDKIAADLQQRLGVKPKFTDDPESGFRDYKFNPRINGQLVEIGAMTKNMNNATAQTHAPYEQKQFIERNAMKENRTLTPEEAARVTQLNNTMRSLFNQHGGRV